MKKPKVAFVCVHNSCRSQIAEALGNCPAIPCKYREDWGLDDPTGKNDDEFSKTIHSIHEKILELTEKIKNNELISMSYEKSYNYD